MLKMRKLEVNSHLVCLAIIFLVTFCIYWNSLQGDFIWDDKDLILNHERYLEDWKNLFSAFAKPFFGKASTYRPILIVSFIVDYQLWGSNPFGFHYTNVVLHIMNAMLVYLLVFILFKHRYLALFSSLIFATHPIQTEAVAWISGRNDVILTLFSLLTILFYIRWQNLKGIKRVLTFLGFLTSYACVLLTKESGIVVLLLVVLVDCFFRVAPPERLDDKRKAYLSIILVSFLYIFVRMSILGKLGILNVPTVESVTRRFLGVFVIYAYYFKMLFFPIHQTANPFTPYLNNIKDPIFFSSFFFVLSLMLITIACWKYFRDVSFITLWIFISLLPVSGIVPLTVPALEHRLYLGGVGFSMLVPLLLYKVPSIKIDGILLQRTSKVMISLLLLCLVCVYGSKTIVRNTIWKNETHFWFKTVQDSPFSVFAHNNLGLVYAERGHYSQAIGEFRKALSLNPSAANVHANLGAVYVDQGLYQRGIDAYEKALKLKPKRAKFYNNLGHIYYQVLKEYNSSSKVNPEYNNSIINLVNAYGVKGLYQKSLGNFKQALALDFCDAEVHNNLGDLYYLEKSYQYAAEEYKLAIAFNPYYADAYNNLGLVRFDEECYDDAREAFLKALNVNSNFAEARNNLALVYLNVGLYPDALRELTNAMQITPENAEVHFNLALVYLQGFKDRRRGVYYLKKSLELDPHRPRAPMIREMLTQLGADEVGEK